MKLNVDLNYDNAIFVLVLTAPYSMQHLSPSSQFVLDRRSHDNGKAVLPGALLRNSLTTARLERRPCVDLYRENSV